MVLAPGFSWGYCQAVDHTEVFCWAEGSTFKLIHVDAVRKRQCINIWVSTGGGRDLAAGHAEQVIHESKVRDGAIKMNSSFGSHVPSLCFICWLTH